MSLVERTSKHLPKDKTETVRSLINEYKDLFTTSDQDVGRTNIARHKINTGSNISVKQPPRRTPILMREEVDRHINEMLQKKVIEPADGPWSSGIAFVKKKDGSTRFCVDYRRLNDLTTKEAYPLPHIDDFLEQLSGNKWFSTLDLCSEHWQVEMESEDRPKTHSLLDEDSFSFVLFCLEWPVHRPRSIN